MVDAVQQERWYCGKCGRAHLGQVEPGPNEYQRQNKDSKRRAEACCDDRDVLTRLRSLAQIWEDDGMTNQASVLRNAITTVEKQLAATHGADLTRQLKHHAELRTAIAMAECDIA